MLKNKIKVYTLALITTAAMAVVGLSCLVGGMIISNKNVKKVYDEVAQTPAYTQYFNNIVENYYQDYKDGKITFEQYQEYSDDVNVDGYIKNLPAEERVKIEDKIKSAKNSENKLKVTGGVIGLLGFAAASGLAITSTRLEDEKY